MAYSFRCLWQRLPAKWFPLWGGQALSVGQNDRSPYCWSHNKLLCTRDAKPLFWCPTHQFQIELPTQMAQFLVLRFYYHISVNSHIWHLHTPPIFSRPISGLGSSLVKLSARMPGHDREDLQAGRPRDIWRCTFPNRSWRMARASLNLQNAKSKSHQ